MKKQLLLGAALFTAMLGANAQVTTVLELKNTIENATEETVNISVGDLTLNFQTELNEESKEYSITVPETVKNLTISGSTQNSTIVLKNQLIKPSVSMDKLEIKNLNLTGNNPGNHYLLNLDGAGTTIGNILIDGCTIQDMRGIFRIKTEDINVNLLKINNCIAKQIGSYSVIALDCGYVTSVELTNNTFCNFSSASEHKNLLTCKNPASGTVVRIANFKMDKNTIHGVVKSGSYIADFGKIGTSAEAITGDFIFTNNLLGAPYTDSTKAFSKVDYATAVTGGNYISSSWTMSGVDKFFEVINPDGPSYTLNITAAQLFPGAANSDFTIAKGEVYSASGDPRWNGETTSISKTETANEIISCEYFTIAGTKVNELQKGLNLVRNKMTDGSVIVTKVYVK